MCRAQECVMYRTLGSGVCYVQVAELISALCTGCRAQECATVEVKKKISI